MCDNKISCFSFLYSSSLLIHLNIFNFNFNFNFILFLIFVFVFNFILFLILFLIFVFVFIYLFCSGKTVTRLLCKECKSLREVEEPFFDVCAPVAGVPDLQVVLHNTHNTYNA